MADQYSRKISIYIESGQAQVTYEKLRIEQERLVAQVKKYVDAGKEVPEKVTKNLLAVNEKLKTQQEIISGKLSPTLKELAGTYSNLKRELESMRADDAGFAQKREQTIAAKQALDEYKGSLNTVKTSFKDMLAGATGVAVGVVMGNIVQGGLQYITSAISSVFKFNSDLEKSVKNLSAITGATGQDLEYLKQKAIAMGASGSRSATEYVEAMKLIGSAKPELLANKEGLVAVTEAAKLLANASGLQLPDASKRLTDALNQYAAPAAEAAKYVDALAAASKYGAAEVPEVTDALLAFGSQAKSANINIYESAAAIELLAEKGIKGSEAGTQLRNVFLRMNAVNALPKEALDSLKAFGVNTAILTDNTLSLEVRLKEFAKISSDTTALVNVFGKENFNAGQIVLQNIPRYAELAKQVKEQGVASTQANTNTATLSSSWEKMKNVLTTLFSGMNFTGLAKLISGFADATTSFAKFLGIIKSTSQLLEEERQSMLQNEIAITALNVGNTERTKIIQTLQEKYPQYLSGLDAEKASNEEIHKALELVNQDYLLKIALQQKQEELEAKMKDAGVNLAKYNEIQLQVQKAYAYELDHLKSYNPLLAEKIKQQTDGLSIEEQLRKLGEGQVKLSAGERDALGVSIGLYNKLKDAKRDYLAGKFDADAFQKEFEALKANAEQLLAGLKSKSNVGPEVTITATKTNKADKDIAGDKKSKDEHDKDLAAFEQFYQKLLDLKKQSEAALISEDEKEIQAVRIKYEALERELAEFHKKGIVDVKRFQDTQKLLIEDYNNELERLNKKQFDNRSENEYKATLFATQQYYERLQTAQKENLDKGKINEAEYNLIVGELYSQAIRAKITISKDYVETVKSAQNDLVRFENDLYQQDTKNFKAAQEFKKASKDKSMSLAMDTAKIKGDLEWETSLRLRQLEEQYTNDMAYWSLKVNGEEQNQEVLTQITENYAAKRDEINRAETAKKVESGLGYLQQIVGVFSSMSQIMTNLENADLNRMKKAHTSRIKYYDDELKAKRLSKKEYDKLVDAANKEQAQKEDEIKKKQFERNKAMQIVTAVINTAAAIASAWGTSGNIYAAIAMSVIAAAAGAAQIGVIASQQYQGASYAEGTDSIAKGPSHAQGGIKMIDSLTGKQVGEMEGDEAIISKATTAANPSVIAKLIKAKGRPIAINEQRASENIRIFAQGVTSINPSIAAYAANKTNDTEDGFAVMQKLIATNTAMLEELKKFNAKKFGVSLQEINDGNKLLDYLTDQQL